MIRTFEYMQIHKDLLYRFDAFLNLRNNDQVANRIIEFCYFHEHQLTGPSVMFKHKPKEFNQALQKAERWVEHFHKDCIVFFSFDSLGRCYNAALVAQGKGGRTGVIDVPCSFFLFPQMDEQPPDMVP